MSRVLRRRGGAGAGGDTGADGGTWEEEFDLLADGVALWSLECCLRWRFILNAGGWRGAGQGCPAILQLRGEKRRNSNVSVSIFAGSKVSVLILLVKR